MRAKYSRPISPKARGDPGAVRQLQHDGDAALAPQRQRREGLQQVRFLKFF